MTEKQDAATRKEEERSQPTETRNAVESAIDLAKKDKSVSWEVAISRFHKRVTRWKDIHPIGSMKPSAS
ncbi:MAG TPA: hypothetical protein VJ302_34590 [Blastocatellia bacterium]|nr:hypothetical protein [Blastocatellia bacterium]